MPFLSNTPRLWLFVMGILVGYILVRVKYRSQEVTVNEASNPFRDLQMCEERMEDINTTIQEGQATFARVKRLIKEARSKTDISTHEMISLEKNFDEAKGKYKETLVKARSFCGDCRTIIGMFAEVEFDGKLEWFDKVCSWADSKNHPGHVDL